MLDPNNPIAKIIFLICMCGIINIPGYYSIKWILYEFKQFKLFGKILAIVFILFWCIIMFGTIVMVIDRLINFNEWHIGGLN